MLNIKGYTGVLLLFKYNHIARDTGSTLLMQLWSILKVTLCKTYWCPINAVKDTITNYSVAMDTDANLPMDISLTLKAPITTEADYKFCDIYPNYRQK